MISGPATATVSISAAGTSLLLVITAQTWPDNESGTTALPEIPSTEVYFSPPQGPNHAMKSPSPFLSSGISTVTSLTRFVSVCSVLSLMTSFAIALAFPSEGGAQLESVA
ncbi:hypothetical protein RRF57_000242 [Xylaria bambusicola]|uniref:Uncharacterized protein n=1 Tax=Xylaria bambusicola TaxID=326684 RepID=A0AAN7UFC1_9PEZI